MNYIISISCNKHFWATVLMFCLFSYAWGQTSPPEWTKDPLKKPDIWAKIEKDPTDSTLWASYYGKEWTAMSKEEADKVTSWKFQVMLSILAKHESVVGFVINPKEMGEDFFIDDAAFKELLFSINGESKPTTAASSNNKKYNKAMMRKELDGIEAIILAEDAKLKELKKNIRANFSVIEDHYKNIFKEFGLEYVYYKTKHPDGNYSEMKWVEEQEKKLQKLKQDQIAELRKKYMVK
jgi:hypothetical protein